MFTIEQLIQEARNLAKEYPNCKTTSEEGECSYNRGDYGCGVIGCIWGNAFKRLGIHECFDNIKNPENFGLKSLGTYTPTIDTIFERHLPIEHTIAQGDWCRTVQSYQDEGYTWAEAVRLADKEVKLD